jgi:DNA polymerase III sliding clamp (beta) subunit (PCNA family)
VRIPKSITAIADVCEDNARYALGGVQVGREKKKPFAVATDGRRLIHATWNEEDLPEFKDEPPPASRSSIIIPANTFKEMAKLCNGAKAGDRRVFLDESNGEVLAKFSSVDVEREVNTKPVEGKVPSHHEVIDRKDEPNAVLHLSGELLLSTVKAVVGALELAGSNAIKVELFGECVRMSGSKDGKEVVAVLMNVDVSADTTP